MQKPDAQDRRKTRQLVLPVGQQRRRRDQQRGLIRTAFAVGAIAALAFELQEQRNHLDGLAQAHVIGQTRTQPELLQKPQPLHAFDLIGRNMAFKSRIGIKALRRFRARAADPAASRSQSPATTALQSDSIGRGWMRPRPESRRTPDSMRMRFEKPHALAQTVALNALPMLKHSGQFVAINLDPLPAQRDQPALAPASTPSTRLG